MKKIILVIVILISSLAHARETWRSYSFNPNIDSQELGSIQVRAKKAKVRYLPQRYRDEVLSTFLQQEIKNFKFDQKEKLYKEILYSKLNELKKNFPFITKIKRDEILQALHNHEYYTQRERRPGNWTILKGLN